jgi:hypothetical protein
MINQAVHLALLPLLAALLLCTTAAADDEPRQYDVEVIVFTQQGGDDDEQLGQTERTPPPAGEVLTADRITTLSPSAFTLGRVSYSLSSAPGYHVLLHRAWRQLAYDRNHALGYPVHVAAGGGFGGVQGTITLIRERYLHLDVDLSLSAAGTNAEVSYPASAAGVPVYRLSEQRRIRSSEIHYFDHPRFGVIARVTPYEAAQAPASPDTGSAPSATQDASPAQETEPAGEDEPSPDDDAPVSRSR